MTQKRLACSLLVSLLIAACSGSTTTKKKDGSADFLDGSTGGTGGTLTACTGSGATAACTCNATDAACTGAGTFCSSASVRSTCEMVNGCLVLSATTKTCGTHQTCSGGLPAGDCKCNTAPAGCTAAGTFC